jgi:protein-S-isoprenylcysteine O-methyltransferase Ste14
MGSPWPLLFLPIALLAIQRFVIAREERYLEAKFGEVYRDYKARVRRWI